jgi:uncharacterized protein (DUF2336 family)
MKDVAPRIFRSLESPRGRAEFDVIVTAAVAAYGSLRSPTEAQSLEFGRLVAPLFERTRPETRRALSASLSHSSRVPPEIVDLVVDSAVEISAPFLVSTPSLSPAHLERLAARGDERIGKILAGRRERGLDTVGAASPAPRRAYDEAPPLAPAHLSERAPREPVVDAASAADAAAFVRDTLRQIAGAGRGDSRTVGAALLRAARHGEAAFFGAAAARLGLSAEERRQAQEDEGGRTLAQALKNAGVDTGQALAILMLVRPKIGLDVQAFREMAERYRTLPAEPLRGEHRSASDPVERAPREPSAFEPGAKTSVPERRSFNG